MQKAKKQQQQQPLPIQDEETQVSGGDDYDMEPAFNEIDKLEMHGINAADIGKLKAGGLCTVLAVLMW